MALFGADAAANASRAIHVYISRLRRMLGDVERLVTTPTGYLVRADSDEIAAWRFERLLTAGGEAFAGGWVSEAAATLRAALALWRGRPLSDIPASPSVAVESARLEGAAAQRSGTAER